MMTKLNLLSGWLKSPLINREAGERFFVCDLEEPIDFSGKVKNRKNSPPNATTYLKNEREKNEKLAISLFKPPSRMTFLHQKIHDVKRRNFSPRDAESSIILYCKDDCAVVFAFHKWVLSYIRRRRRRNKRPTGSRFAIFMAAAHFIHGQKYGHKRIREWPKGAEPKREAKKGGRSIEGREWKKPLFWPRIKRDWRRRRRKNSPLEMKPIFHYWAWLLSRRNDP